MWWLVTVLFGVIALASRASPLLTLVWIFGIYAMLDGIAAVALGIRTRDEPHWVWTLVQGVVSVLTGVVALVWPGVTALALLFAFHVRSVAISTTSALGAR